MNFEKIRKPIQNRIMEKQQAEMEFFIKQNLNKQTSNKTHGILEE